MDMPNPPDRTWLNMLWAAFSFLGTLFMGLLLWNVRRQVKTVDELGVRTGELEKDRVTKGDIAYIADRVNEMNTRMGEQHAEILQTIIRLNK